VPKKGKGEPDQNPGPEPESSPEPKSSPEPALDASSAPQGKEPDLDEPPYDSDKLPIDEAVRRIKIQMADKEWRHTKWHITIVRTIAEDPSGADYLLLVFGRRHGLRPKATKRAWALAQDAVSASPIGRALGAEVGLVAGGGLWFAETLIPWLGGGFIEQKGSRTPLAALAKLERHYRLLVIKAGAQAIIERERWAQAHPTEAAGTESPTGESAGNAAPEPHP
jgi:hypothetical protein